MCVNKNIVIKNNSNNNQIVHVHMKKLEEKFDYNICILLNRTSSYVLSHYVGTCLEFAFGYILTFIFNNDFACRYFFFSCTASFQSLFPIVRCKSILLFNKKKKKQKYIAVHVMFDDIDENDKVNSLS